MPPPYGDWGSAWCKRFCHICQRRSFLWRALRWYPSPIGTNWNMDKWKFYMKKLYDHGEWLSASAFITSAGHNSLQILFVRTQQVLNIGTCLQSQFLSRPSLRHTLSFTTALLCWTRLAGKIPHRAVCYVTRENLTTVHSKVVDLTSLQKKLWKRQCELPFFLRDDHSDCAGSENLVVYASGFWKANQDMIYPRYISDGQKDLFEEWKQKEMLDDPLLEPNFDFQDPQWINFRTPYKGEEGWFGMNAMTIRTNTLSRFWSHVWRWQTRNGMLVIYFMWRDVPSN